MDVRESCTGRASRAWARPSFSGPQPCRCLDRGAQQESPHETIRCVRDSRKRQMLNLVLALSGAPFGATKYSAGDLRSIPAPITASSPGPCMESPVVQLARPDGEQGQGQPHCVLATPPAYPIPIGVWTLMTFLFNLDKPSEGVVYCQTCLSVAPNPPSSIL